jgi:hypothetical protein
MLKYAVKVLELLRCGVAACWLAVRQLLLPWQQHPTFWLKLLVTPVDAGNPKLAHYVITPRSGRVGEHEQRQQVSRQQQ